MAFMTRITGAAALGAALLMGYGFSPPAAHAAYIVTLTEQGGNVVANGSGSLNTSSLLLEANSHLMAAMDPAFPDILTGPTSLPPVELFRLPNVLPTFGPGGFASASTGSGNFVGYFRPELVVPLNYTSGDPLQSTATWDNATFMSLGVTPGTYRTTWGSGANADSFTLIAGAAAVPEPSSLLLLGGALAGLLLVRARRRSRDAG